MFSQNMFQSLLCWNTSIESISIPSAESVKSFNPCCVGIPLLSNSARFFISLLLWFQSLLCWNTSIEKKQIAFHLHSQTLVSILVVLEYLY